MFLHVARCQPQKNQELLIEAFNEAITRGNNVGLLIIGKGFDSVKGKELMTKSFEQIHYLGSRTNIYDYMSCTDAFCLSSLYEGMPITVIEALLSGLPIISTPVCGVVDSVVDGENGFISKDFSKDKFVEMIEKFIEHKYIIKEKADSFKKTCPYNISLCSERYINWFNS